VRASKNFSSGDLVILTRLDNCRYRKATSYAPTEADIGAVFEYLYPTGSTLWEDHVYITLGAYPGRSDNTRLVHPDDLELVFTK
jgi:hypothetical protein